MKLNSTTKFCFCSTFVWFLPLSWLLPWLLSGFLSWLLSWFLSWFLPWFSLGGLLSWLLAWFLSGLLSWLFAWFLPRFLSRSTRTRCSSGIATFRHSAWAPVSIGPALGVLLVTGGTGVGDNGAHTLAASVPVGCRVCRCCRRISGATTIAHNLQC